MTKAETRLRDLAQHLTASIGARRTPVQCLELHPSEIRNVASAGRILQPVAA
jgi:hypothetical protein